MLYVRNLSINVGSVLEWSFCYAGATLCQSKPSYEPPVVFLLLQHQLRETSGNLWHAKKIVEGAAKGTFLCVHHGSTLAQQ